MQRLVFASLLLTLLFAGTAQMAASHCEVPCGIYDDKARFTRMFEDAATIHKAMVNINELAAKNDGQSANQLARWVSTKGDHATHTQHVIAQYFMSQRIKPGTDEASTKKYLDQLTTAHAVMIGAMKCKQNTEAATADALKAAIEKFHVAYYGKASDAK